MNKVITRRIALILMIMFTLAFVSPLFISATSLDELSQEQSQQQEVGLDTEEDNNVSYEENEIYYSNSDALADYMRGYTPITEENMQFAATTMSPFVRLMGNLTGCIVVFTMMGIFFVTALDLCYIAIPPVRSFLNPQSTPNMGMPIGGMNMPMQNQSVKRKWVSDEAVAVVNQNLMPAQSMPNMYGGPQPPQTQPVKIVIFEYFKKRVLFMVIFAIATTLLLSSIFTDCGINIAELGVKVMNKLNGAITEIEV